MAYEAYEAFLTVKPSTNKAYYTEIMQELVNSEHENASNYYVVQHENRATKVYADIGVRITKPYDMTRALTINDDYLQITFKSFDYSVNIGDYFKISDYSWIVTNTDVVQTGVRSCVVQRCNVLLRFIETTNAVYPTITDDIIEIYGVAENKVFEPTTNNYVRLPNEQLFVKVQANSDSQKICSTNRGTRFILGNPAKLFETVGVDSISMRRELLSGSTVDDGILSLKLKMGQSNSTIDNISERVARQKS